MKKFLAIFVILAMTAPLFAANEITLSAVDAGNGQLAISYDAAGSDDMPVGISFRVALSNGATVAADAAAVVAASSDFNVYIDYVNTLTATYDPCDFVPGGPYAKGDGIPMANVDTAGAIDAAASEFAVCMGRLEETDAPASGALVTLQLDGNGATDTVVTITADTVRGEVVGSTFTVNYPVDTTVTFGGTPPCYYEGLVLNNGTVVTAQMVTNWVNNGSPDLWCQPCHVYGNANGDDAITALDVQILVPAWAKAYPDPLYDYRADFNHDGAITALDVQMLVPNWAKTCVDIVQ